MLNKVIQQINANLDPLCWTDHLCGLSTLARREVNTKTGMTTEVYPVSCGCDINNCWKNGQYQDLVPNGKKSVIYWDHIGVLRPVPNNRINSKRKQFEVDLKLVAWFNLKKLGKENCGFCHEVYSDLCIHLEKIVGAEGIGNIKVVNITMDSQEQTRAFFRKYSYGNKEQIFFYPYEACTFNAKVSWIINKNCIEPAVCGVEIEC